MRMTIILASVCSFLISCSTLELLNPKQEGSVNSEQPVISPEPTAVAQSSEQTPNLDMGDGSQVQAETQAAEQQQVQSQTMNEERSNSELDSAAPEVPASDTFYAGTQQKTETPTPELFPATLPEKQQVTSHQEEYSRSSAGQSEEKAIPKKSVKRESKKHSKKSIAKKSSKQGHKIAKKQNSKKHKALAKKSSKKMDCKKIAKHSKKASKKEIAMCKAEKRKVASKAKRVSKISSQVKRI